MVKYAQPTPSYDVTEEPVILSKVTSDILLKQEKPSDVLALYLFYYITSKWQDQKNAYCTTSYTAKGLKWSEKRVRKIKRVLIELGLIEDLVKRDSSGKVVRHFIKVNFKWVKESGESHPVRKRGGGFDQGVVNLQTNTTLLLDEIQPNSYKKNIVEKKFSTDSATKRIINGNSSVKDKDSNKYIKLANKLSKIIQTKKNILHSQTQIKSWANEFRKLHTINKVKVSRQKKILKWYKNEPESKYLPVVESGKSFREKFIKLESAMNRKQFDNNPKNSLGYKGNFKLTKKATKM